MVDFLFLGRAGDRPGELGEGHRPGRRGRRAPGGRARRLSVVPVVERTRSRTRRSPSPRRPAASSARRRRRSAWPSPAGRSARRCSSRSRCSAATTVLAAAAGGALDRLAGRADGRTGDRSVRAPRPAQVGLQDRRPARPGRRRLLRRHARPGLADVPPLRPPSGARPSSSWARRSTTGCRRRTSGPGSNEALLLFHQGDAGVVAVTGSKEKGDQFTEAEAGARYLETNGVPSAAIVEAGGDDTWQNLSDVAPLLEGPGVHDDPDGHRRVPRGPVDGDRLAASASRRTRRRPDVADHRLVDRAVLRQGGRRRQPRPDRRLPAPARRWRVELRLMRSCGPCSGSLSLARSGVV